MGLYPRNINEYLGLAGIPKGPYSQVYFVDPVNGSASNTGLTWNSPLLTLAAAYALCTDAQHDTVVVLSGATALSPSAAVTWAKNYTHLVGLGPELPGMGQRSRIVNTAANDLATLFTLSGSGCIVKNIQFFDGKDSAADGACVLVSGSRNHFQNVFVAGMGDATASGPFSRAGSYSLKVSGSENYFEDCTIGLDTVARTAANSELIVSGPRNRFYNCDVRCNSTTAGKFLVKIDNSTADLRDTIFKDCIFLCYTTNWAAGINNAFSMPSGGNTHYVILKDCQLVGVSVGWADNVDRVYTADPAPNAGAGVSVAVTT